MNFGEITVYGRTECVQCKATVRKAEALGLTVTYVDLAENPEKEHQLRMEGFRSLPVVEAGQHRWVGFRDDYLEALVKG